MDKEYFAFISYQHQDENWAKWLQIKLENYKLPSAIRERRPGCPQYIRPVFRDGTDLSGGVLINQLQLELLRSKYLIVICSPNATKSKWVNEEIQTIIDDGRQEQIIPFIIKGIPYAEKTTDECFPKALRDIPKEKELLGINVQEVGKNMALVRLIATILGVRFDELWQRHRRRRIRQHVVSCCMAIVLLFLGLFLWDYNRPSYKYYADYVDCNGIPEGVIPLTKDQVSHRNRSYQFEYRRIPLGEPNAYSWRVVKVTHVDSNCQPQDITDTEWKDRYAIQTIEYNESSGVVRRVNFCDKQETVLLRHMYSEIKGEATAADFIDAQEQRGPRYVGSNLTSMTLGQMDARQEKSKIIRYVYERDDHGHIICQTYHKSNNPDLDSTLVSDGDGIFGRRFILDSLGRRIQMIYLGKDGRPTSNKYGEGGRKYRYDTYGNIAQITYIDTLGNPTMNELLHAIYIGESDSCGNIVKEEFYDTIFGHLCMTKGGFAKRIARCDLTRNCIEITFRDTNDLPCVCSDGYAKIVIKPNKLNNDITDQIMTLLVNLVLLIAISALAICLYIKKRGRGFYRGRKR